MTLEPASARVRCIRGRVHGHVILEPPASQLASDIMGGGEQGEYVAMRPSSPPLPGEHHMYPGKGTWSHDLPASAYVRCIQGRVHSHVILEPAASQRAFHISGKGTQSCDPHASSFLTCQMHSQKGAWSRDP